VLDGSSSGQQTAGSAEGSLAAAAAAAAAAAGSACGRAGRKRQQPDASSAAAAAAAAALLDAGDSSGAADSRQQQQQQQVEQVPEIRIPVHAVVMAGFSEYFKALICSWSSNLNRVITLDVGVDESLAAQLMVEFMYTGTLPQHAAAEELLKMVRLADQYQVRNTTTTSSCNSTSSSTSFHIIFLGSR
jgi:hypothetical protein